MTDVLKTYMPYTRAELERACKYVDGHVYCTEPLLAYRVFIARHVGPERGHSPHTPSMRIVIQAANDYRANGKFNFSDDSWGFVSGFRLASSGRG